MGNACGCGSEKPVDPTQTDKEKMRQEELAKALEGADATPVDLAQEIPNKDGLLEVKEEDEQSNQEDELISVDSDIIPEKMIPAKIPLIQCVKDTLLEKIMRQEQRVVYQMNSESVKIYQHQVLNLSSDKEEKVKIAEQFLCQICNNMIIPGCSLENDEIQKESIKFPQCLNCDGLACYHCWMDLLQTENPQCPKCGIKLDPIDKSWKENKDQERKSANHIYDQGVSFCNQKLLIKILFEETIIHKCQREQQSAFEKATALWDTAVLEMLKKVSLATFLGVDDSHFLRSVTSSVNGGDAESRINIKEYGSHLSMEGGEEESRTVHEDSSEQPKEQSATLPKKEEGDRALQFKRLQTALQQEESTESVEQSGDEAKEESPRRQPEEEGSDKASRVESTKVDGEPEDGSGLKKESSKIQLEPLDKKTQAKQMKVALAVFFKNLLQGSEDRGMEQGYQQIDQADKDMITQLLIQQMKIKISEETTEQGATFTEEDIALFEEKKSDMLHRIGETLYPTLFKYLDYLNHVMTVCADTQISDKGCPYEKCKKHGIPMSIGEIKEHLANECNKIELECSRCQATFRRPWKDYHDCVTVYQERLAATEKSLAEKERELEQVKSSYEKEIQKLKQIIKDKDQKSNVKAAFDLDLRGIDRQVTLNHRLETENLARDNLVDNPMFTQQSDHHERNSFMGTNRKLIPLATTRAVGVQPSEKMVHSVGIGPTERDVKSIGVGSTKQSVHSRPVHFRRKSHMIAGIYSEKTSTRSQNSSQMNKWDSSLEPHYSTIDSREQQQFAIKVRHMSQDDNREIVVRSQSVLGSQVSSENKAKLNIRLPPLQNNRHSGPQSQTKDTSSVNFDDSRRSSAMQAQLASPLKSVRLSADPLNASKQMTLKQLSRTPLPEKDKSWQLTTTSPVASDKERTIKEQLEVLRTVEANISQMDKYVEYCMKKYQPFVFNLDQFMNDVFIEQTHFLEDHLISNGQHKGSHYWGQYLGSIDKNFIPHGFGILVDKHNKIMQIGTFKQGKEQGQQRLIQSYPLKSRYFTQFTSAEGVLEGPALIERADGRRDIGVYKKDKQDGIWRYKHLDGKSEVVVFSKGKVKEKTKNITINQMTIVD